MVIEHRWRYGYRRVTEELRAHGMILNHKRIARIMREDNLLVVRQERSRRREHTLRAARVYLNLAKRMSPLGPNQLWVADITNIRLARVFVYLAAVLDVFSRKVIGWALGPKPQSPAAHSCSGASDCESKATTGSRAALGSGRAICMQRACKSFGSMGCCPA